MRFRAIFVGGVVDGQERVLPRCNRFIHIRREPQCIYRLLFAYGEPATLVYSVYDVTETFDRLWHRYVGEDA